MSTLASNLVHSFANTFCSSSNLCTFPPLASSLSLLFSMSVTSFNMTLISPPILALPATHSFILRSDSWTMATPLDLRDSS